MSFVLETGSYLCPHSLQLSLNRLVLFFPLNGFLHAKPIIVIMMYINNSIQSGFLGISYNFFHTFQPRFFQFIFRRTTNMSHPSNRYTYGSKSGRSQFVECNLCHRTISPNCFVGHTFCYGIQLITQVPSHTQPTCHLPCVFVCFLCIVCLRR